MFGNTLACRDMRDSLEISTSHAQSVSLGAEECFGHSCLSRSCTHDLDIWLGLEYTSRPYYMLLSKGIQKMENESFKPKKKLIAKSLRIRFLNLRWKKKCYYFRQICRKWSLYFPFNQYLSFRKLCLNIILFFSNGWINDRRIQSEIIFLTVLSAAGI